MNDAIDASSSTTSTVCGFAVMPALANRNGGANRQLLRRRTGKRPEGIAVERVEPVAGRAVGHPGERHVAASEDDDIHERAVDENRVRATNGTELEVDAAPGARGVAARHV